MSAETLRKAAALMRERAAFATPGPWVSGERCVWGERPGHTVVSDGERGDGGCRNAWRDARHIASWHPAVALAVADWLDDIAAGWPWDDEVADLDGNPLTLAESVDSHAITVARAYLGETE